MVNTSEYGKTEGRRGLRLGQLSSVLALGAALACGGTTGSGDQPEGSGVTTNSGGSGATGTTVSTGGSGGSSGSGGATATTSSAGTGGNTAAGTGGGKPVAPMLGESAAAELEGVQNALDDVAGLTTSELLQRYPTVFEPLSYSPAEAVGLELIQGSSLALNEAELATLKATGLVISSRQSFPNFTYGYSTIYMQDLPLFVSADSMLYAVHRSYDEILMRIEEFSLVPQLTTLLEGLRGRLGTAELTDSTRADLDFYLTVAHSLLAGELVTPTAGADAALVQTFYEAAVAASGSESKDLFGSPRIIDFSQFTPRGHYTTPTLQRYFRSMMWLGRIDFRLIETQSDGSQVLRRDQVAATIALAQLLDESLQGIWDDVDQVITAFVGEHDYMTIVQTRELMADLQVTNVAGLAAMSDQDLAQAIVSGGYGTQRISSHYMVNGVGSGTLPLSSSFALFGQRYTLDSHVFSNVVYDRVAGGAELRMLPSPLDVGFAALGNNHAASLLAPELDSYNYAPDLASMRELVQAHPSDYWQDNLYNSWLSALRTLSPGSAVEPEMGGLPSVARTKDWSLRMLNTQLASWAELRHDTLLYVKQSYTGGVTCEFPDAYVEPYPEFFAALVAYAERGLDVMARLPQELTYETQHFSRLRDVASTLGEMAEAQRTGTPHSEEHLAFINDAVVIENICGGAVGTGWYPRLFVGDSTLADPTIADVHTQPTDEAGNDVGRVLHVGTGNARLLVVTVETCSGPRAYAGLASSYFEVVEDNWQRLTDDEWANQLNSTPPADVPWLDPVLE